MGRTFWYEVFWQGNGKTLVTVPWLWLARFISYFDRRLDYAPPGEGW